jgi:cytochrome b561
MIESRYHPVAILLHWVIAALIVVQFVLARLAETVEDEAPFRELALLANHKSVGITILILAIVRLAWRKYRAPPKLLPMPNWQRSASEISHWTLYALLFLLPLTGWLMSSASAATVSWFNIIVLPDLVGADPELEEVLEEVHETFAKILLLLASIHILAALKHSLIDGHAALRRITSPVSIVVFLLLIVAGLYALGRVDIAGNASPATREPPAALSSSQGSEPPLWQIDHAVSSIRFTGNQVGAGFDGEWTLWSAAIRFDAERLERRSFDVNVVVAGVETGDDERDETIVDADWFDVAQHPEVLYRASSFKHAAGGGFTADGNIVVKGLAYPAELSFSVGREGDRAVLDGIAELDRLALRLGTGDWADPAWVGQFVTVDVHVEATVTD